MEQPDVQILPNAKAVPGIFITLVSVLPLALVETLPGVDVKLEFKFVAVLNTPHPPLLNWMNSKTKHVLDLPTGKQHLQLKTAEDEESTPNCSDGW